MQTRKIATDLGEISVRFNLEAEGVPLVFLHGILLDSSLWSDCDDGLQDKPRLYIDMPAHGRSGNVGRSWELDECAAMLHTVLDAFGIQQCVAIGQSWGSMTALRAAVQRPERFAALGLFNMPFRAPTSTRKRVFWLQKKMLRFPRFYAKQAAKALFSESLLRTRPELAVEMQQRLAAMPAKEIARVIDAVIINAQCSIEALAKLQVPALAIVGEDDYVGTPPHLETITVAGGHVSPYETPSETTAAIRRVLALASS